VCAVIFADSFTEHQMYVVFEFEDSGHDLESVEVSTHFRPLLIACCHLLLHLQHYSDSLTFVTN